MANGQIVNTVGKVFVPGGMPTITYNPRASLQLEQRVLDYLDERHRILSLSGPTKSGKTVLLRSVIQEPLWIAGGDIRSLEDFHNAVSDKLGIFPNEQTAQSQQEVIGSSTTVGISATPMNIGAKFDHADNEGTASGETWTAGRQRSIWLAAKQVLTANKPVLVIDDFHYIPQDVQLGIVRGLKELVFEGLPVVLASVPHRAFDAVRVEKEMTGTRSPITD
jgi:hypothetical protein